MTCNWLTKWPGTRRVEKWLSDRVTPDNKKFILWLLGIGAFFAFIWLGDVFPKFRPAGNSAIEYALVAGSILVAAGFGRAVCESQDHGVFKALGLALSGLVFVAFIFLFLSVSMRPGFPLYLISSRRGQGAAILILCSAIYGYFMGKSHAAHRRRIMTSDQRTQFDQFGCVSRCIIELAKTKGHPITDDEFCARFDYLFPNRDSQYGMLLTSQIAEVIKGLDLGRYFLTFRRYPAIVWRFGHGQSDILVLSEINLYGNNENDHCSLLKEIDDHHFRLWTPLIGQTHDEPVFEAGVWEAKACQGVVLQP